MDRGIGRMKLTFGLIGGGRISHSHIAAAEFDDLAELKAGCFSRNSDKNMEFGRSYGLDPERVYTDYAEMAEAESKRPDKLDFVIVTTPNISHYPVCREFLSRGFNVVCDKPVTVTSEQAYELERIAEERGLLFAVTYTYGGLPFVHLAREIYNSGEVGKAYFISLKYYRGSRLAEIIANDIKTWRFTKAISGPGGTIADLGTHLDYLGRFLMGSNLKKVLARLINKPGQVELDTTGTVLVEYDNGVEGTISVAQAACGHDNDIELEILCEKGTIRCNFDCHASVMVDYLDGRSVIHREPGVSSEAVKKFAHKSPNLTDPQTTGFINIYSGFLKTLASRKEGDTKQYFYPTLRDGICGIKFVEACIRSNQNGNIWVNL